MKIEIQEPLRDLRGINQVISTADANLAAQFEAVADEIERRRETSPFVLLSGPSGSGKTTAASMMLHHLRARGCKAHILSMDHYFYPLTEAGADLESPLRVDTKLFNDHLRRIAACEEVELPHFDFTKNVRIDEDTENIIHRQEGEPIIIEGIHALNPTVAQIDESKTVRVFVSVDTTLKTSDGHIVSPRQLRLLRRMLRDDRERGRSIETTVSRLSSVTHGEENFILPYRDRAEFEINTYLKYEIGVYAPLIGEKVKALTHFDGQEALEEALSDAADIPIYKVPHTSLIREFIGHKD